MVNKKDISSKTNQNRFKQNEVNNNTKADVFVADSNIYIESGLDLVKTMAERGILGVPYTVHRELDGNKRRDGYKGFNAREGNRWLETKTKEKPQNILFQKRAVSDNFSLTFNVV